MDFPFRDSRGLPLLSDTNQLNEQLNCAKGSRRLRKHRLIPVSDGVSHVKRSHISLGQQQLISKSTGHINKLQTSYRLLSGWYTFKQTMLSYRLYNKLGGVLDSVCTVFQR